MTGIEDLADSTVARIRTVVPALWGALVTQLIVWGIAQGWVPDEAVGWSAAITGATVTVATGIAVWAVYSLARWVEKRDDPVSRFVARALLVVLKAPSYAKVEINDDSGTAV